MILSYNFSSSWMTSDSLKCHAEFPYSLLHIKSKRSRVYMTRIYVRHAHMTRKRKKANIPFKHTIPLPIDNLLFRNKVLMERNSSRFVQCHLNAPSGKSSPHTITHHLVQPSYFYQIMLLSIAERKIWLCKKYLINNLIYPAAYYMKPDNNPVFTLPT